MQTCATTQKRQLGQFFTKDSNYILDGFEKFTKNKNVTDPFAGGGDLLFWAKKNGAKNITGYDIDEKYVNGKTVFLNDSLLNPKQYDFILTNPPYLNINKASHAAKERYFYKFNFDDLYQISLSQIKNSKEGIIIVPINFLSAKNSKKIRNEFFAKFKIIQMNYFKCQVFPDTTYNVVAFYYKQKRDQFEDKFSIKACIYPEKEFVSIGLSAKYDWAIGGEFLSEIQKQKNILGISRLTERDVIRKENGKKIKIAYNHVKNSDVFTVGNDLYNLIKNNIILLKAIDSGSEAGKIALENIKKQYGLDCLISKESSRHMIYLIFNRPVSIPEQEKIIELFNKEINDLRHRYLSLFLTNYRDNNRKRISFDFVYKFINYLYNERMSNSHQAQKLLNY